jgi:hypothetical protein
MDMFPVREHQFGTVARNSEATYEFQFTNLYVEDVVIRGVRSSCGCITPSFKPQRVKTHETASISVKYNTDRFVGSRSATVTVTFGEPFFAEVQLKAGGFIRGDVVVEPGRIDFGNLAAVEGTKRSVNIDYRGGNQDWQIVDVTSTFPHVRVALQELQRQRGRIHYQLVARLLPEVEAGLHHVDLMLVTNDPANREIPLTISANIVQPLQVTPSFFELGNVTPGQEVTKHILVRSAAACQIASVEADSPQLRVQSPSGAKTLHRIPVTLAAGSQAGPWVGRVTIRTDQGGQETVEVHAHILP